MYTFSIKYLKCFFMWKINATNDMVIVYLIVLFKYLNKQLSMSYKGNINIITIHVKIII